MKKEEYTHLSLLQVNSKGQLGCYDFKDEKFYIFNKIRRDQYSGEYFLGFDYLYVSTGKSW